jgi:multidrug resistance efflux pump
LERETENIANEETSISFFRSENVQEIISERPGFLTKWSLWIYTAILAICIYGTWLIKYPDIIEADAILSADNAPKEIVNRQDGKIKLLFVSNETSVKEGQTIAWIESTADHKQVLRLSLTLDSSIDYVEEGQVEKASKIFKGKFQNLGELQPAYQTFLVAWQKFNDFFTNGYYVKRMKSLHNDEIYLGKMHETILEQRGIADEDLKLTKEAIDANSSLLKDKVISKQDMRDLKSKQLNKQVLVPQLETLLLNNEISQSDKKKEINELVHEFSQQIVLFQQSTETLKSVIYDWERKYIISSPTDGKIAFTIPLQENQFLQAGKLIGYVNPSDSRFYALVKLPQNNLGKVVSGQSVQLRFEAYPYQEFGVVEGKLDYISKVATDSGLLATITLSNGLITNNRVRIQYRSGLKSQALIITKQARLLERFYRDLIKSVQR